MIYVILVIAVLLIFYILFIRIRNNRKSFSEDRSEDSLAACSRKNTDDTELIAVIAAAIAAASYDSTQCRLEVRSIRRISQRAPLWNKVGRKERISGKL